MTRHAMSNETHNTEQQAQHPRSAAGPSSETPAIGSPSSPPPVMPADAVGPSAVRPTPAAAADATAGERAESKCHWTAGKSIFI